MTPEGAREIVKAINARCWVNMGIGDGVLPSLEGVSLAEMLEAKGLIQAGNAAAEAKQRAEGGSTTISMIPDDRLIAAVYCMEHYPADNESILCLPATPRLDGHTHIAIGVVAVTPTEGDDA